MQMKSEHLTVAILFYSTLLLLNMIYRNDMKVNQINYHVYIFFSSVIQLMVPSQRGITSPSEINK